MLTVRDFQALRPLGDYGYILGVVINAIPLDYCPDYASYRVRAAAKRLQGMETYTRRTVLDEWACRGI